MGSQIPNSGGDRSRTNWTPAMECYFIDLMLDQVHKGNRMGHTFNKQAWNDMLIMFNANFGSPYDVNVLKSRYSTLWKQYNDIKNLLDQNGFSWDSTRQMVIAEKYVWDAYIQAHPDAQSYRNKPLMNFNDLCLIYAHTAADGRYSLSSHDIDFDEDIQPLNVAVGVNVLAPVSEEPPRTDWIPSMDPFFVKLMLDQLRKGNKINNTFTRQAWKDMITLFNAKFSSQYGKKILKRRYKKLFKYYTGLRSLIEERGFSWDEKQQMIAADDFTWDHYIRTHPDAHSYRKKPLLNYQDLSLIYENTISNGVCHQLQRGKNIEDGILHYKNGEEREGHVFAGNGHLPLSEDPVSEGPDLMIGTDEEEIQSHVNDDSSRMDWTPSMDRCLIDLLLEQVHKMNKIDCTIDDQAWIDMVALIRDRFGLQHDKDILKSRYKSLEEEYHGMKDLLDRRGFWWDEMQQMITAYDYVWDAYIEEHPGAASYRDKPKPNYNDLCLIYGNSNADRQFNTSGQYASCNGDGPRVNNSCHRRTDWKPPMDRYFIDLMLEQVRNGSMINQKFNKLAWADMVTKFSAEFGSQYDKDVLKSRFLNLRKRFNDIRTLLEQSGFVWDEMQQMISADYTLWDAYVKEHPEARSYRNRTLPNFNDLFLIYGNGYFIQTDSYTGHSMDAEDDDVEVNIGEEEEDDDSPAYTYYQDQEDGQEYEDEISFGDGIDDYDNLITAFKNEGSNGRSSFKREMYNDTLNMGMDDIFGDLQPPAREFEIPNPQKRRKSATSSKSESSKRVKRTFKEEVTETTDEKQVFLNGLGGNEIEDSCSIERIVAALQTVPDMDDGLFLEACKLLEDERKAKMFVAMDATARRKWLIRKLRG
ncbi:hypothetical protein UlMin_029281 [Ulmus minor]